MRPLLLLSLSICVCFAACADHRGDLTAANAPQSPINQPDPGAIGPGPGGNTVEPPNGGANGGNGGGTSGEGGNSGTGTEGSTPVPEPSTLLLVGSGLACAAMLRRRRQTPSA